MPDKDLKDAVETLSKTTKAPDLGDLEYFQDEAYKEEIRFKRRNAVMLRNVFFGLSFLIGTVLIYAFSPPGSTARRVIEFGVDILIAILD